MNTDDDKGSVTAAPDTTEKGAPSHTENTPPDTPDKTALKDKSLGFVILFFVLGFAASLVVGWVVFPKLLYSQKRQPIDFNHALHVELVDDGCASCHFFRPDGSFSGVPRLAQPEPCVLCMLRTLRWRR